MIKILLSKTPWAHLWYKAIKKINSNKNVAKKQKTHQIFPTTTAGQRMVAIRRETIFLLQNLAGNLNRRLVIITELKDVEHGIGRFDILVAAHLNHHVIL